MNEHVAPGTICMAVYRPDRDLLETQLASIAAQTHMNWRCEIGVDGPDPITEEILDDLVGSDPRFRVTVFGERVGFYRNFERVLMEAADDTPWVALADQDDAWYPDKIEALLPLLAQASLAFGQARVIGDGTVGKVQDSTGRKVVGLTPLMLDNRVTGSFSVMRGELLRRIVPFPEPTDVAYHDHWIGVCASLDLGLASTSEVLQDYVQHDSNVIGEERRSIGRRHQRLAATAGRSIPARLDYISRHRWGWRVNMARLALQRYPDARSTDRNVLATFAMNRLSTRLVATISASVVSRSAPLLRSGALMVGALWAPRVSRRRPG